MADWRIEGEDELHLNIFADNKTRHVNSNIAASINNLEKLISEEIFTVTASSCMSLIKLIC
jgi:hypothetical protein